VVAVAELALDSALEGMKDLLEALFLRPRQRAADRLSEPIASSARSSLRVGGGAPPGSKT
jgi:hypothetical protein